MAFPTEPANEADERSLLHELAETNLYFRQQQLYVVTSHIRVDMSGYTQLGRRRRAGWSGYSTRYEDHRG